MGKIDDGGPAFPVKGNFFDASGAMCGDYISATGMSLRDSFAQTAPMMDPTDICDMMGWEKSIPYGGPDSHEEGDAWQDTVFARWHELPMRTRLASQTKYAYAWADAMLAARSQATGGGNGE